MSASLATALTTALFRAQPETGTGGHSCAPQDGTGGPASPASKEEVGGAVPRGKAPKEELGAVIATALSWLGKFNSPQPDLCGLRQDFTARATAEPAGGRLLFCHKEACLDL